MFEGCSAGAVAGAIDLGCGRAAEDGEGRVAVLALLVNGEIKEIEAADFGRIVLADDHALGGEDRVPVERSQGLID